MNEMRSKTPNTKHQRNTKLQAPSYALFSTKFGIWRLELLWCLVVGVWCLVFLFPFFAQAEDAKPSTKPAEKILYENNFEEAEVGKVPDDLLVLDGALAV